MSDAANSRPGVLRRIGAGITTLRNFITNLIFVVLLVVVVVAILGTSEDSVVVPERTALVLDLDAPIMESRPDVDPIALLFRDEDSHGPIVLRDVLDALEAAAEDDRVEALVLDLSSFPGASPATLSTLGAAITSFQDSGKPVLTGADFLGQSQYYLASHADELYLNPLGQVLLEGFAAQPTYFAAALEKLRIRVNVFRVGEYKAAVEPFLRNDMSESARENSQALMDGLWAEYRDVVAANRGMEPEALDALINDQPARLAAMNGDFGLLAVETGLVDELLSRDAFRARMVDLVGADKDEESYSRVHLRAYLRTAQLAALTAPKPADQQTVGVVIAEGNITGGREVGEVGETTAGLIRKARSNDDIAAIVLRVNSPGGSAFFSEVIRKELELAQVQGKPVVVSMGGVAASGGYWISATADRIFAEADTITGSIGIFGLLPTFEDSAQALGINSDGVGTHALSGAGNLLEPLNPAFGQLLQLSIDRGYERFIDLVARGREMEPGDVDDIAQGRVWLGRTALELGLVDELGGIEDASRAAATLAGATDYRVEYLEKPRSPQEMFVQRMLAGPVAGTMAGLLDGPSARQLRSLASWTSAPLTMLGNLTDPENVYALCSGCPGGF